MHNLTEFISFTWVYGVNRHSIASLNIILTMGSSQMFIYMSNIHVYEAVKTKQLPSEKWENSFYMTSMKGLIGAVSSLTHRFTILANFVLNNWQSFAVFWIRKMTHLCGFRPFQDELYAVSMMVLYCLIFYVT